MDIISICELVLGIIEVWAFGRLLCYASDLDDKKLELDKQAESLDDREQALKENFLAAAKAEEGERMRAQYCVSESDKLKYTNEPAVDRAAKKHLAMLIANDILKKYPPTESVAEDGKRIFTINIRVKK